MITETEPIERNGSVARHQLLGIVHDSALEHAPDGLRVLDVLQRVGNWRLSTRGTCHGRRGATMARSAETVGPEVGAGRSSWGDVTFRPWVLLGWPHRSVQPSSPPCPEGRLRRRMSRATSLDTRHTPSQAPGCPPVATPSLLTVSVTSKIRTGSAKPPAARSIAARTTRHASGRHVLKSYSRPQNGR